MIELLKKEVSDFLEADKKGIKGVNWYELANLKVEAVSYHYRNIEIWLGLFDEVLSILTSSKLMSYSLKGNFLLFGQNVLLNPRFSNSADSLLYFTRKKDAMDYAIAFHGDRMFGVYLAGVTEENVNFEKRGVSR